MKMHRFTQVVLILAGGFTLGAGLWAFFAPVSFYEQAATFPPYNEHFIHDIGAFQIGIGVTLLAALRWTDAPFVVLAGVGTGSVFHLAAHVVDRDLGGQASDLVGLSLLAAALVAAAIHRGLTLAKAPDPGGSEEARG